MLKGIALFAFYILTTAASSQTYPIPVEVFDRMVWEVQRGRACDTLQARQAVEINAMLKELAHQGQIIELQAGQITDAGAVIQAERMQRGTEGKLHMQEVAKKNRVILFLGGLSLFELVLLLAVL